MEWIDLASYTNCNIVKKRYIRIADIEELRFIEQTEDTSYEYRIIILTHEISDSYIRSFNDKSEAYRVWNNLCQDLHIGDTLSEPYNFGSAFRNSEEEKEKDDPYAEIERLRKKLREND